MDIQHILRRLPHRYPFLLVDRVLEFEKDVRIKALKNVTMNEPFFAGHFPARPVMPGVLIVEAMAQSGALLMSKTLDVDVGTKTIMFMSVDNARFRSPVRPGDVLRMNIEVLRARGGIYKFKGRALVGEKLAAEAEFAAMTVEKI